jgi:hypothetical protein
MVLSQPDPVICHITGSFLQNKQRNYTRYILVHNIINTSANIHTLSAQKITQLHIQAQISFISRHQFSANVEDSFMLGPRGSRRYHLQRWHSWLRHAIETNFLDYGNTRGSGFFCCHLPLCSLLLDKSIN